jgi:hypothetical protein
MSTQIEIPILLSQHRTEILHALGQHMFGSYRSNFLSRERASQPARNKRRRHWRREMEGELKAKGKEVNMACLSRLTPLPPPPLPTLRVCRTACGHVIRMASILRTVSMMAKFGQQQWSYTNFWGSDWTLRSRDRILEFSQEILKICAAARNLDCRTNFGLSGRYNQPKFWASARNLDTRLNFVRRLNFPQKFSA